MFGVSQKEWVMKNKIIDLIKQVTGSDFEELSRSKQPGVDFQYNGVFQIAHATGKNSQDVAIEISDALNRMNSFIRATPSKKGFIDIVVTNDFLEKLDCQLYSNFKGRYMVDFGGPNIAKPLHVGHLRSLVLGDSITKILRANGADVVTDIHFGDWGLQMGKIISEVQISGKLPTTAKDLETLYPRADQAYNSSEERREVCGLVTKRLQDGLEPEISIWKTLRDLSVTDQLDVIRELNITFDYYLGESDSMPYYDRVKSRLDAKEMIIESDGALIIDVNDEGLTELPPVIFKKRDGASLYATTELMTIESRSDTVDHIIYVTDARQQMHFEQIFRVARKCGMNVDSLDLVAFGTVNSSESKKAFKTRSGLTYYLRDLINAAAAEYEKFQSDPELAREIAVNAIKFWDLSQLAKTGYSFSPSRMMANTGYTGPYVLYSAVRAKHILDKAGDIDDYTFKISTDEERQLAFLISDTPFIVNKAAEDLEPSVIVKHIYALAKAWGKFYSGDNILESPELIKQSRLKLVQVYYSTIKMLLELVGMTVPTKM